MACFNVTPGASEGLVYEYANDPRPDATVTMHAHRGLAFLRLSVDGKQMQGDYYTGRDRANYGSMQLRRLSPKRLDFQVARNCFKQMETERHG